MSAEHHQEDELQKMLALKRHEAPPAPFFKGFSHRVMASLDAPDPAAALPWWKRLGHDIDSKPVLVCVSGIVVCGLLAAGMIASLRMEPPKKRNVAADNMIVTPPSHLLADPGSELAPAPAPISPQKIGEPVVISGQSPFGDIRIEPARANFNATGASQTTPPK
jgi:hypothetical protein